MKKETIKKWIKVLFIFYCLALFYILFLHNSNRGGLGAFGITIFSKRHFEMCNIIPFKTVVTYLERLSAQTINTNIVITNLTVNLILLLPMGMSLPVLFENKFTNFWKFLIFILLITILIEIIQFITLMGVSDIDDVILNTIGACIGYGIVHLNIVKKILKLNS